MEEKSMMKALVRHEFGGPEVLRVEEVERPALEDDRVLVRVRASSLNKYDWHQLRATPAVMRFMLRNGVRRPKDPRLGSDFAGVVEAVGKDVTGVAPGDEVLGIRAGAYAEYVSAKVFCKKPANVSFEAAGTVGIAGTTALQGLRDHGTLRPGDRVLVNGASGGVGTYTIQIAKALGAHVTAVVSTRHVEQAHALGADRVIDRTQENWTRLGDRYDVVADVAGGHSWRAIRRALAPGGRVVIMGAHGSRMVLGHIGRIWLASRASKHSVVFFVAKQSAEDFQVLADMLASGQVTPAIDKTYTLAEAREAFRVFGEGHVSGKLVLTV
jgi:NADPH:quinone reductase-like Zn-dependent oxidoreductase